MNGGLAWFVAVTTAINTFLITIVNAKAREVHNEVKSPNGTTTAQAIQDIHEKVEEDGTRPASS